MAVFVDPVDVAAVSSLVDGGVVFVFCADCGVAADRVAVVEHIDHY